MKSSWQLVAIAAVVAALTTAYLFYVGSKPVAEIQRTLDSRESEARGGGIGAPLAAMDLRMYRNALQEAKNSRNAKVVPLLLVTVGLVVATVLVRRRAEGSPTHPPSS